MSGRQDTARFSLRSPLATAAPIAAGAALFPKPTTEEPCEDVFADWRRRLARNLSR